MVFLSPLKISTTACQDIADDDIVAALGRRYMGVVDLTCASGAATWCSNPQFYEFCPVSCGFCDKGSPFAPETYTITGVWYHAHLLGSEMYATLIPEDDPTARIDLTSAPVWTFEDQSVGSLGEMTIIGLVIRSKLHVSMIPLRELTMPNLIIAPMMKCASLYRSAH